MKIHYLQHVPFEDPANILEWAAQKGHKLSSTRMYIGEALPAGEIFDWLIIMGGPMNIYEEDKYPWLRAEKEFIKKCIDAKKVVLGICLGAQLIADVLGGKVNSNKYKEIGWFPVSLTPEAINTTAFSGFAEQFTAFHWHGDTFEIPPGAVHSASSEACVNQAFVFEERVIGLQFHLESSHKSIERLIENCSDELVEDAYIQNADQLSQYGAGLEMNIVLQRLLDNMEKISIAP